MTTVIIYLFALFTNSDIFVCDLWTRAITRETMIAACGTDLVAGLRVDVYSLDMSLLCSRDASALMSITKDCGLSAALDQYVLRLVRPLQRELLCVVESENKSAPSYDEIAAQCPNISGKNYSIEFSAIKEQPPEWTCPARILSTGSGLYNQAQNYSAIATTEPLAWLAGKLIWTGQVRPTCNGSGLDPFTLAADACGMSAAQSLVTRWQNQFDAEIYQAALANDVPAKLLKKILLQESQLWPFYEADHARAGETTVMQITDNGFDTLLRFDPALDADYLNRDDAGKYYARAAMRDMLVCVYCNMDDALEQIKKNMDTYARLIAAFQCRAVTINPALIGNDTWRQAVVDYNGSADYLTRIEQ
jgi:hypothetical protein